MVFGPAANGWCACGGLWAVFWRSTLPCRLTKFVLVRRLFDFDKYMEKKKAIMGIKHKKLKGHSKTQATESL